MKLKFLITPIVLILMGFYFACYAPLPDTTYYGFAFKKIIGFGVIGLQILMILKYIMQSGNKKDNTRS